MSDRSLSSISWWRTDIGNAGRLGAFEAVLDKRLSDGTGVKNLEALACATLGVKHAIATPSGSMALLMAMMALKIGPGDEVIVPNYTWIASAHGPLLAGACVVLADVEADRPVLSLEDVARKITPRTKAIIPVHLCGRACDMLGLIKLAAEHGIAVVEDACQAIMSKAPDGRYLGTIGDLGCFSHGAAKLLPAGQGGLVVTDNDTLNEQCRAIKTHGMVDDDAGWEKYVGRGFNFKMSDILASIAAEQFKVANGHVDHVVTIYRHYENGLANLPAIQVRQSDPDAGEVPLWTEIRCNAVTQLKAHLAEHGIETKRTHPPLTEAPHLATGESFPNSYGHAESLLILPSGPSQPLEAVERTIDVIRSWALGRT